MSRDSVQHFLLYIHGNHASKFKDKFMRLGIIRIKSSERFGIAKVLWLTTGYVGLY